MHVAIPTTIPRSNAKCSRVGKTAVRMPRDRLALRTICRSTRESGPGRGAGLG